MTYSPGEPIFIGGLKKSGTTLLRALLGNHSNIFSGLETHWYTEELLHGYSDLSGRGIRRLMRFYDVSRVEIHEIVKDTDSSGRPFIERFLGYLAARCGKKRWLEKTSANIEQLHLIRQLWPRAPFLHVTRDLKDTFASWKKKKDPRYALDRFIADLSRACVALDGLPHDQRYLEVCYEDLVTETRSTLRQVVDFVGERWEEGIEVNDTARAGVEFDKVLTETSVRSTTLAALRRPVFTDSIGQWTTLLSAEEVETIDARAPEVRRRFGQGKTNR